MCERLKRGRIISLIWTGHGEGGQGGKRSEASPENRRCGRYCVQSRDQVEPLEVLDGIYMDRLYSKNREVSERFESERNTITFIPLKYNPEGPFYHHSPTPTSMNDFFAASTRGTVPQNCNCLLSYLEQLKGLSIFSVQQKENRELHTVLICKRLH